MAKSLFYLCNVDKLYLWLIKVDGTCRIIVILPDNLRFYYI